MVKGEACRSLQMSTQIVFTVIYGKTETFSGLMMIFITLISPLYVHHHHLFLLEDFNIDRIFSEAHLIFSWVLSG